MKFYARENPKNGFYEARLLDVNNEVIFHLQAEDNAILYWSAGFLEMANPNNDWHVEFQRLLNRVSTLHACRIFENEVPFTFLTVICGLVRALEAKNRSEFETKALEEIRCLLQTNTILNFRALRDKNHYFFGLLVHEEPFQSSILEKEVPSCILQEWWEYWFDALLPEQQETCTGSVKPA